MPLISIEMEDRKKIDFLPGFANCHVNSTSEVESLKVAQ